MKKRAALGLAGLAAVAAIGGTWAYWNQNLSVDNEFKAGNFDSDIVEEFKPEEDWLPGETVEKVVSVKNSGNVDMAVMTKITQKWDGERMVFEDAEGNEVYAAEVHWGDNVAVYEVSEAWPKREELGITKSVGSFDEADNMWVLTGVQEQEDDSLDLYFVYSDIVEEEGETPALLTSVTMSPFIQSDVTDKVYEADENGALKVVDAVSSGFHYEDAQYTMTINAKTVQATFDAVKEVFGSALEIAENDKDWVIDDFLRANSIRGRIKTVWLCRAGEKLIISSALPPPGRNRQGQEIERYEERQTCSIRSGGSDFGGCHRRGMGELDSGTEGRK